jgi:hypothetical protein
MVTNMRPPIFVRTLSEEEREALEEGLRSSEAFVLRRCQILLASAGGEIAPQIAKTWAADSKRCATPSTTSTGAGWML